MSLKAGWTLAIFMILISTCAIAQTAPSEVDAAKQVKETAQAEQPAEKAPAPVVDDAKSMLVKSDTLWKTRHKSGNAKKSIEAAEAAGEKGADEFEVLWRVSRGCFWVAEQSSSKKVKTELGEKGWKAGQKAAKLKPSRVEGWYWGVVSLGQYSKGIGIFKAFFKGISGDFEEMNEKAIALDPKYGFAGPSRSFGRYWFKLPKIKRDLERSEKLMRESIRLYPKKLRSHFYLAETLLEMDRKDEAKKSLETCIALDPRKEEYPDGIIFIKECKALYEKEFK